MNSYPSLFFVVLSLFIARFFKSCTEGKYVGTVLENFTLKYHQSLKSFDSFIIVLSMYFTFLLIKDVNIDKSFLGYGLIFLLFFFTITILIYDFFIVEEIRIDFCSLRKEDRVKFIDYKKSDVVVSFSVIAVTILFSFFLLWLVIVKIIDFF